MEFSEAMALPLSNPQTTPTPNPIVNQQCPATGIVASHWTRLVDCSRKALSWCFFPTVLGDASRALDSIQIRRKSPSEGLAFNSPLRRQPESCPDQETVSLSEFSQERMVSSPVESRNGVTPKISHSRDSGERLFQGLDSAAFFNRQSAAETLRSLTTLPHAESVSSTSRRRSRDSRISPKPARNAGPLPHRA